MKKVDGTEIDRREFDHPKVFMIHATQFIQPKSGQYAHQATMNVGVIALSFDRAYEKFRERFPAARIRSIETTNDNVRYIVDDPLASEVAERITE